MVKERKVHMVKGHYYTTRAGKKAYRKSHIRGSWCKRVKISTLEKYKERVLKRVKNRPGLTTTQIARNIGINKHSAANLLLELESEGKVRNEKVMVYTAWYPKK